MALIATTLFVAGFVLLVIMLFLKFFMAPARANAHQPPAPAAARRQGVQRNQESSGDREIDQENAAKKPAGKVGAKKMRKIQEKAARREEREAEEAAREERLKEEKLLEEKRKKAEEKEQALEEEKEEQERILREERKKKEEEEYQKLRQEFTIEEEGEVGLPDEVEKENKLLEFIDFIRNSKVVMLEDLAAHFQLKTQEALERVQDLQERGRITGVLDDRGKYIYISEDELQATADFIRQRGRVSISELALRSSEFINLRSLDDGDSLGALYYGEVLNA